MRRRADRVTDGQVIKCSATEWLVRPANELPDWSGLPLPSPPSLDPSPWWWSVWCSTGIRSKRWQGCSYKRTGSFWVTPKDWYLVIRRHGHLCLWKTMSLNLRNEGLREQGSMSKRMCDWVWSNTCKCKYGLDVRKEEREGEWLRPQRVHRQYPWPEVVFNEGLSELLWPCTLF